MKYLKFVALSFATILVASQAFAAQGVYGTWKFPEFNSPGFTIVSTMTVATGTVSATATCSANGQSVTLTVSAPANITASQIQVLGSAEQSVTSPIECNANIAPSTMNYAVSSDDASLTLSQDGQSFVLPRQ